MNFISLIIGIIAVIFYILSIQCKSKRNVLYMQLVANVFYSIQYLLLNALSAGFITILSVFRCFIYNVYETKNKKIPVLYPILFIVLITIISIITYTNILSLIPLFINIAYILCTYFNNLKAMRLTFLGCAITWIIYNYKVGAFASLIGNVFEIVSCLIALKRFKKES